MTIGKFPDGIITLSCDLCGAIVAVCDNNLKTINGDFEIICSRCSDNNTKK